jgi:molecular chaperone GrpE
MTKEKKKIKKGSNDLKAKEDQLEPTSSENKDTESLEKEEPKLLEERAHHELEYFSKDELAEKNKALEADLKKLKEEYKKAQEWKNKYTFLQAEFENAQKRWDKNRQNLRNQNIASVIRSLLPLYDSFKKAVDTDKENSVLNGFFNQFMSILKSYKAEPIKVETNDMFDYNLHEALTSIEKEDVPKNSILDIIQDGWKLGKDVIRYSKVVISKEPKPPESEPEPELEENSEEVEEAIKEEADKEEKANQNQGEKDNKEEKSTTSDKNEESGSNNSSK